MKAIAMSSAGDLRVWPLDLDAVALSIVLEQRLEVLHLEADVIERASLRADGRLRRLA